MLVSSNNSVIVLIKSLGDFYIFVKIKYWISKWILNIVCEYIYIYSKYWKLDNI